MDQNLNNNINLAELSQAIAQKRLESPEFEHLSDKEILSHIISQHKKEEQIQQQTAIPVVSPEQNQSDRKFDNLPDYAKNMPIDFKEKVERLIEITLKHGLVAGIKMALKEDPAVGDAFHDALVDKLHNEIQNLK